MNYIVDFLIDYSGGPIPYLAIFALLLACGMGIPIPEDIILIAAGIATYYGICDVHLMTAISLLGVLIGDSTVFWLGHHYGRKLLTKWPFRSFIDENRVDEIRTRLKIHGGKLLFAARFMPGFRAAVFFTTGLLHIPYKTLLIYDGLAALISVPAIIYSVYYFGDFVEHVIKMIKKVEGGIIALIILVLLSLVARYFYKKRKK